MTSSSVAVVGAGPAGLAAAETLAMAGVQVDVYDSMPSVGRKFLLAGRGGLNLTHAEPFDQLLRRYGTRSAALQHFLQQHNANALRSWAGGLGVETFVGSSKRVFPKDLKAAPLLRAWLHRLRQQGVRFFMRHRWLGWSDANALRFATLQGETAARHGAVVLALGGASWARLGSDGAWVALLRERGVDVAPLLPSNCGFDVGWSEFFSSRFAGAPVKTVAIEFETLDEVSTWLSTQTLSAQASAQASTRQAGEFVITAGGVEGSLIYAASAALRDRIAQRGSAIFKLDLLPARSVEWVHRELAHPRGPRSFSTHLKTRLGLSGVKSALLWELVPKAQMQDPAALAALVKALPITVRGTRPIDEAISSAGGVRFEALDQHLMLRSLPGVFCAGEMLDWEAPTGGYLLTACFATGRAAGQGAAAWLAAPVAHSPAA